MTNQRHCYTRVKLSLNFLPIETSLYSSGKPSDYQIQVIPRKLIQQGFVPFVICGEKNPFSLDK